MNILIRGENFDKKVIDLIYAKQLEFKQEKQKIVSLEKTIERLIKDAYLPKK